MNPQESEELRGLMETLRAERGISVLLIEHDMKRGHERVRPHHGARLRREDRRGRAPGGPQGPPRHRGLPRGARRDPAGGGHPHLLRLDRGAEGDLDRGQGGRGRHADRLQRRRQVDDAALDLGPERAQDRQDHLRRQGDPGHARPRGRRPGDRAGARGPAHLPAPDRGREPRHGRVPALQPPRDRARPRPRLRAVPAPQGAREPEGRARCRAASSRCSPWAGR